MLILLAELEVGIITRHLIAEKMFMIQENELRQGNWFIKAGMPAKFDFHDEDDRTYLDEFEPIPLTPEILEKCGFEKSKEEVYGEEYLGLKLYNGICRYEICFFPGNTFTSISLFHKGELIGRTWEYLHQLQNLYFALTGQELNVKL
jgi:hypothetical protein